MLVSLLGLGLLLLSQDEGQHVVLVVRAGMVRFCDIGRLVGLRISGISWDVSGVVVPGVHVGQEEEAGHSEQEQTLHHRSLGSCTWARQAKLERFERSLSFLD